MQEVGPQNLYRYDAMTGKKVFVMKIILSCPDYVSGISEREYTQGDIFYYDLPALEVRET
jgi:hypothetical protein